MFNKAIKYFENSLSPDNDEGWNNGIYDQLSLAYERIGGYEKVIELMKKLLPDAHNENDHKRKIKAG